MLPFCQNFRNTIDLTFKINNAKACNCCYRKCVSLYDINRKNWNYSNWMCNMLTFLTAALLEPKKLTVWINGHMWFSGLTVTRLLLLLLLLLLSLLSSSSSTTLLFNIWTGLKQKSHKNGLFKLEEYIFPWRIYNLENIYLNLAIYIS